LQQGKLVIPVLVKNEKMPDFKNLPESIRDLQRKNAVPVRRHPDMRRDCERLAKGIERALNHNRQQVKPITQAVSTSSISKTKFTLPDLHWINIPAGKVTLEGKKGSYIPEGQKQTFDVSAFAIAKYPVTNKQYAEYVRETGKEPGYWTNSKFNEPMQPVVGVSWFDAIAFCDWLSEKTGEKISLPTEQQWQRAAQGDDDRVYPWGNLWDVSRCNNQDSGNYYTTPVTAYEGKGDSPYGVVDMSGNIWEWCLTAWKTGDNHIGETNVSRVLRGGSFRYSADKLRSANRNGNLPDDTYNIGGFRCLHPVT